MTLPSVPYYTGLEWGGGVGGVVLCHAVSCQGGGVIIIIPGAITIPTTPGGEGNPNLSKGVTPAGGWQPAMRLSIGQRHVSPASS